MTRTRSAPNQNPSIRRKLALTATAATLTAAVLIGVPALLWTLAGWPLPDSLPSTSATLDALAANDVAESTVINSLAVIGWVAWLHVAYVFAVEIIAAARRDIAHRIILGGHTQQLVRPIVAALFFATTLITQTVNTDLAQAIPLQPLPAGGAVATPPHVLVVGTDPLQSAPRLAEHAPVPDPLSGARTAPTGALLDGHSYVVVRGDNLWDLADRHLGDPFRWREIHELSQETTQPDGRRLTDPNLIYPGWILRLPLDATHLPDITPTPEPTVGATDKAESPTLSEPLQFLSSGISTPHLDPAPAPTAAVADDSDDPPTQPANDQPPEPANQRTTEAPGREPVARDGAPPSQPAADKSSTSDKQPWPSSSSIDDTGEASLVGRTVFGIGATTLATGLLVALRRRRRIRIATRTPGSSIPPTPPELAPTETALHLAAEPDITTRLTAALQTLATARKPRPHQSFPEPVIIQLHDEEIQVLLDDHDPSPPSPWRPLAGGKIWALDNDLTDPDRDGAPFEPLPALVTLGDAGGGQLIVNLEAAGTVAVTGPDRRVRGLLTSIVHELATTPHSRYVTVDVCTPKPFAGINTHPNVSHSEFGDIADEILGWARSSDDRLAASGLPSAFALRSSGRTDDPWAPRVLIVTDTDPKDDDRLDELIRIANRRGRPLALITTGPVHQAAMSVEVDDTHLTISPYGLVCAAQHLDDTTANNIGKLLDAATAPTESAPTFVPNSSNGSACTNGSTSNGNGAGHRVELRGEPNYKDPPYDIEVQLLGDVDVTGTAKHLTPQEIALVAYLATADGPVRADQIKDALWPTALPTDQHWYNVLSRLRTHLGRGHLPDSDDGRYHLHAVITDLDRFANRVTYAERQPTDIAIHTLREALELVRGQPFAISGHSAKNWTWTEDHQLGCASQWECRIADTAHHLAALALDTDNHDLSTWAATQGLKASPLSETLVCDLICAHLRNDNRRAAHAIVDDFESGWAKLDIGEPPSGPQEFLDNIAARVP